MELRATDERERLPHRSAEQHPQTGQTTTTANRPNSQ
jgi:hypothetical protein